MQEKRPPGGISWKSDFRPRTWNLATAPPDWPWSPQDWPWSLRTGPGVLRTGPGPKHLLFLPRGRLSVGSNTILESDFLGPGRKLSLRAGAFLAGAFCSGQKQALLLGLGHYSQGRFFWAKSKLLWLRHTGKVCGGRWVPGARWAPGAGRFAESLDPLPPPQPTHTQDCCPALQED